MKQYPWNGLAQRLQFALRLCIYPRAGTCSPPAVIGEDYSVMEESLSFNGTQQLQCFNIFITNDSDVEGTETFNISVVHDHALSFSTGQILIDPNTAVFTILDDDNGEFTVCAAYLLNWCNYSEFAIVYQLPTSIRFSQIHLQLQLLQQVLDQPASLCHKMIFKQFYWLY